MKIALFSPSLNFGGRDIWTLDMACGMPQAGIEVSGVGVWKDACVNPDFVKYLGDHGCGTFVGRDACVALANEVDAIILSGRPDYIHAITPKGPVIWVAHGQCEGARAAAAFGADCITHWVAVARKAIAAIPNSVPIQVIYNGASLERCTSGRCRNAIRTDWGLKDGEIAVVYIGRIHPEKNPLAAVLAARELGPPFRAVIYNSERPEVLEPYLAECRRICPDVIHRKPTLEIGEVYAGADCIMAASVRECCSLVMLEAWLNRVPIVSTLVGAVQEIEASAGSPLVTLVADDARASQLAKGVLEARAPMPPAGMLYADLAYPFARENFTSGRMCHNWSRYLRSICHADRA